MVRCFLSVLDCNSKANKGWLVSLGYSLFVQKHPETQGWLLPQELMCSNKVAAKQWSM